MAKQNRVFSSVFKQLAGVRNWEFSGQATAKNFFYPMKVAPPTNHWRHQTLITAALSMLSLLLNPRPGVFSTTYPFAVRSNLHILFAPPPPSSQHDNRNLFVHPPFPSSPTLPPSFQCSSGVHYIILHSTQRKKNNWGKRNALSPSLFLGGGWGLVTSDGGERGGGRKEAEIVGRTIKGSSAERIQSQGGGFPLHLHKGRFVLLARKCIPCLFFHFIASRRRVLPLKHCKIKMI